MPKRITLIISFICSITLFSCSSETIRKAPIDENLSAENVLDDTYQLQKEAIDSQADLFASKEYKKAQEHLKAGKKSFENNIDKSQNEKVMDELSWAQSYYRKSIELTKNIKYELTPITNARRMALIRADLENDTFIDRLEEIDDDLISETNGFNESLSPEDNSNYQKRYLSLETYAVTRSELGDVKDSINSLEDKDVQKYVPELYNETKRKILNAENLIASNIRNPYNYAQSVNDAKFTADYLRDVFNVSESKGLELPEESAKIIVDQSRALSNAKHSITMLSDKVVSQADELKAIKSFDMLRSKVNPKDALITREGSKIIIKLKNLNYPVGGTKLSATSQKTLDRMKGLLEEIEASKVTIQGHTDTTGPKSTNQFISQSRAREVAKFLEKKGIDYQLETEGVGAEDPIASNNSETGRKLNRRVDFIINVGEEEEVLSE